MNTTEEYFMALDVAKEDWFNAQSPDWAKDTARMYGAKHAAGLGYTNGHHAGYALGVKHAEAMAEEQG
jgi:hypothetical protein